MAGLFIGKIPSSTVKIDYKQDASSVDFLPLRPNPTEPPIVIPVEGAGDMLRAVYDQNNNGKVDTADYVPIANVPGLQDKLNELANQIGSGGGSGGSSNSYLFVTNTGGETFLPGTPVCKVGASYLRAKSTAPRHNCLGLAVEASSPGEQLKIQQAGLMTMSSDNWDLVSGEVGGLSPAMNYFIDPDAKITIYPPSEFPHYLSKIGYALNNTDFLIDIDLSIKL